MHEKHVYKSNMSLTLMSISKFQLPIHTSQLSKKDVLRTETKLHVNLKRLTRIRAFEAENQFKNKHIQPHKHF